MTSPPFRGTIGEYSTTGGISTPYFTYETDITYPDVGPDQALDHRGLLRILQEAAAIASDNCGYGMKDIPRTGVCWLLSSWRVELLERPAWRSHLTVRTWPRSLDGFHSDRDFLVYHGEVLAARATSRWFLISAATGRIARITEKIRGAYMLGSRTLYDTPVPTSGKTPDGTPVAFSTVAGRRDIDTNHHVNNIHYLDYALEALPEDVLAHLPSTLEVSYRRQILLGTPIRCLYSLTDDGRHQVEIQSGEGDRLVRHAFVWLYNTDRGDTP